MEVYSEESEIMSAVNIPNTFISGDVAVAADVNANFDAIEGWSTAVIQESGAVFTDFPTLPAGSGGANSATNKTYVDDKFKANTGIQLGADNPAPAYVSNAWTVVATATTVNPIPVNVTNPILLLSMFGNLELQGIGGAVQGSFAMKLEYCFDTDAAGTTGTWTSIGLISDTTSLIGGIAYGGISMSGFAYTNPSSAKIVGVRMQIINRGGDLSSIHTGIPRLGFQLTRQVQLA